MLLIGAILLAVFVVPAPWGIAVVAGAAVVEVAETAFWLWLSRRRTVQMGPETLVGATGQVVTACAPLGQVRVGGELWGARCEEGAAAGETVRVVALEGLTLVVERAA
ncbi:MAG TPA: NfeD family protein [Gaiellaceae bacterium]|nr:NfeD family protein [Gaiellaceae bacterium]